VVVVENSIGVVAVAITLAGCPKPGIQHFEVDPPCVCKGGLVTVSWCVRGKPHIDVDHLPADWPADIGLDECKSIPVHVDQPTEFVLTVDGANPANGDGKRPQSVNVVDGATPVAASMPSCVQDGTTRVISGQMPKVSSCGAPVARMRTPQVQTTVGVDVVNSPERICLIPPAGGSRICVDAGGAANIGMVIDGTWRVEIRDDNKDCNGDLPGLASLTFEIDCDHVPHAKEASK
jgi:hypothetical protein